MDLIEWIIAGALAAFALMMVVLLLVYLPVMLKTEVGGYYVVYEDGYKSFSPAGAFESGYTAEVVRAATPSQPTTKTHDLLSTLIGLFLGAKERIGYKPGSVIDKIIAEAVEHLGDWPNETPPVTPYTSDPSGTAVQDAKEPPQ